ncbi:hypothetical protein PF003_g38085 [Phytophthora fragariae]|nr:hypothetical protein PF003_g38085 [Phytophthora fragariae]
MLNRSGHPFLCPVFGALCLLKPRRALPHEIPAAVFINEKGRPDCVTSARVLRYPPAGCAESRWQPSRVQRAFATRRRCHAYVPCRRRRTHDTVSRPMGIRHVQAVYTSVQGIGGDTRDQDRVRSEANAASSVRATGRTPTTGVSTSI